MKHFSLLAILTVSGSIALAIGCSQAADEDSLAAEAAHVASEDLVISQIFGGGGNANAPYSHDFVELFNRGATPVSLEGKAVQYTTSVAPFKATSNVVALPKVTLEPGRYFLVQLSGGGEGAPLPEPRFTPPSAFGMSQEKGKVAIVRSASPLDGCGTKAKPCTADAFIDLVGFGNASQAERSPTKEGDKDKALFRKGQGCIDTNDNKNDFVVAPPAPRTLETPPVACDAADGGAAADANAGPSDDGGGVVTDGGSTIDATPDDDAGAANDDGGVTIDDAGAPDDPSPSADDAGATEGKDSGPGGGATGGGSSGANGGKGNDADDDDDEPANPGSSKSGGGKKNTGSSSSETAPASAASTTETSSDCSMTPGGTRGSGGALSIGGVLLALASLARRRR